MAEEPIPAEERDDVEALVLTAVVAAWLVMTRSVRDKAVLVDAVWSAEAASASWASGTAYAAWSKTLTETDARLATLGLTETQRREVLARLEDPATFSWVDAAVAAVLAYAVAHAWSREKTAASVTAVLHGRALSAAGLVLPTGTPVSIDRWLLLMSRDTATQAAALVALSHPGPSKTWHAIHDRRCRPEHLAADGQTVEHPGGLFTIGGFPMRWPGDTLTAPPSMTRNCFPAGTLVSGQVEGATRRWYSGPMVVVETQEDRTLTGTPNHPVLTTRGWVALDLLEEGDYLLTYARKDDPSGSEDVDDPPSLIEEVFDAFAGTPAGIAGSCLDFHGDGSDSEIDVVGADRFLGDDEQPEADQYVAELLLPDPDLREGRLAPSGSSTQLSEARGRPPTGSVRSGSVRSSGIGGSFRLLEAVRLGYAPTIDPRSAQEGCDSGSADAVRLGEALLGLSGEVSIDPVLRIRRVEGWKGHVYNLSTATGAYSANSIIVHNCRCSVSVNPAEGPKSRKG